MMMGSVLLSSVRISMLSKFKKHFFSLIVSSFSSLNSVLFGSDKVVLLLLLLLKNGWVVWVKTAVGDDELDGDEDDDKAIDDESNDEELHERIDVVGVVANLVVGANDEELDVVSPLLFNFGFFVCFLHLLFFLNLNVGFCKLISLAILKASRWPWVEKNSA